MVGVKRRQFEDALAVEEGRVRVATAIEIARDVAFFFAAKPPEGPGAAQQGDEADER